MSELISGKEAKLAWANGDDILIKSHHWECWYDLTVDFKLEVFELVEYEFKLKPKTILINGIEVPAPFEPKKGDRYWYLAQNGIGYSSLIINHSGDSSLGIGCWKSEEEIKQVVAALQSIFNVK